MNWEAIALALGAAVFSHSLQFRVGKYRVSATLNSSPTHMTFAQALQGAEAALLGQVGTIQSGDVVLTVDLWPV